MTTPKFTPGPAPKRPPFKLGQRVIYRGDHRRYRIDMETGEQVALIERGMVGTVTGETLGWRGTGALLPDIDCEPAYDTTHDGWNVITLDHGGRLAVSFCNRGDWARADLARARGES